MSRVTHWVGLIAALITLSSCVSLRSGPTAPQSYFVLSDAGMAGVLPRERPIGRSLVLVSHHPDALADARALAFARFEGEHSFYQFASWSDRPSRVLLRLIEDRLERTRTFSSVAPMGHGVHGDWILGVRIERIFHDLTSSPNTSRIVFSAELIDRRQRTLIARERFAASAAVERPEAGAAAIAMNTAIGQALDAFVQWIESVAR